MVIGKLEDAAVAKDWARHQALDIPVLDSDTYGKYANWSVRKNYVWIQGAIDRKATFYRASSRTSGTVWDIKKARETVYAKELEQLADAGYTDVSTNIMEILY